MNPTSRLIARRPSLVLKKEIVHIQTHIHTHCAQAIGPNFLLGLHSGHNVPSLLEYHWACMTSARHPVFYLGSAATSIACIWWRVPYYTPPNSPQQKRFLWKYIRKETNHTVVFTSNRTGNLTNLGFLFTISVPQMEHWPVKPTI